MLNYVNPVVKERWFELGILLALPVAKMQEIKDQAVDLDSSCLRMLIEWSLGKSATWGNLLSVIDRIAFKIENAVKPNNAETNVTLDHFRTNGKNAVST